MISLHFSLQGFNEHQMAKLKNNKQFTEDREKEIKQVSERHFSPFSVIQIWIIPSISSQINVNSI